MKEAIHKGSDLKAAGGHAVFIHSKLKSAPDCPTCRYGTLEPDGDLNMKCIDCGVVLSRAILIDSGVLPKERTG